MPKVKIKFTKPKREAESLKSADFAFHGEFPVRIPRIAHCLFLFSFLL